MSDYVPTDFSTLTEEETAIHCTGDHTWGKCDRDGCDFTDFKAMPLEAAETAATGPDDETKGLTRTPPVPAGRDGEKVDNALEELAAQYGVDGRGRFEAPNGMVRRMLARAHRAGTQAARRPRAKVPRDTADVVEAVARLIAGVGRRGRAGDIEALAGLVELTDVVKTAQALAARGLHFEQGYTWAEVARAAGISRQAAEQRWGG